MAGEQPLQTPEGLNGAEVPEALEIIVEDNSVSSMTEDGGAMVTFGDDPLEQPGFNDNLADFMETSDLSLLASDLLDQYEIDEQSRQEWKETYMEGLDLLGLKFEDRSTPWDGACGVFHPLLTDSVVRFQAQTIQEVFPASGPCKTTIVGKKTVERTKQAIRVCDYMNYRTTKKMVEYRSETEKLLFSLPIAGSAFRKVYYDPTLGREAAMFVPAEDFVVNYGTSDLSTCPRATHIMKRTPNQIRKLQVSGFYSDVDLQEPTIEISEIRGKQDELTGVQGGMAEQDWRHTLLEMQVEYDLPGFEDEIDGELTGIALPYVITIEKSSNQVIGIRRNWKEDDPKQLKREHFVHYQYLPGLGFYGFGLVHMIGGLSKSATSLLRQLVDAGTLANLPGGLKTRGLRIKGDDSPILPGEFRDVDVHSGAIKDNIAFLPYKEPSGVLYQLLGDLVEEGRRFASAADIKVSDMSGEAPVGTTLAILERELKVLSAVQARVHASMGKELQILAELIKVYGDEEYPYEIDGEHTIREDFDERVDVIPVSDPNSGTMAQRIMQYQAALQLAQAAPHLYDLAILHRQMLEVLGIPEADKIIPTEEELKPCDPVTENQKIIKGEPVRAFSYQDHEAHIQTHKSFAENPQVQEMLAQAPNAQAVQAAAAAHLSEHVAYLYRYKIEQELGTSLPSEEEKLPDDIEYRLSRLVAPAAAQLTGKAQQQKQAEEDAAKQEDPIIQMQQKELELKEKAQTAKEAEGMAKIQSTLQIALERISLERDRLGLNREKMQQDGLLEGAKIVAGVSADQMDADAKADQLQSAENLQGYKMGLDLAKSILDGIRIENDKQSKRSDT